MLGRFNTNLSDPDNNGLLDSRMALTDANGDIYTAVASGYVQL